MSVIIFYILFFNVTIFSGDNASVIPDYEQPKYVVLSFDDGPHAEYTHKILDVLKRYDVKATFFVVGKQVAKFPAYLKDIHYHGHEICNHTYDHPNLTKMTDNEIIKQLQWTRVIVNKLTGQECMNFRPPGGRYDKRVIELAGRFGYNMILWSVFPQDHRLKNSREIARRVVRDVYDGSVVLLHSGLEPTIKALPEIILKLKADGYEFVTVSDLIIRDKNSPNLYSFYRSCPVASN